MFVLEKNKYEYIFWKKYNDYIIAKQNKISCWFWKEKLQLNRKQFSSSINFLVECDKTRVFLWIDFERNEEQVSWNDIKSKFVKWIEEFSLRIEGISRGGFEIIGFCFDLKNFIMSMNVSIVISTFFFFLKKILSKVYNLGLLMHYWIIIIFNKNIN